jgi:predicted nucleotidyltransferase
MTQNLAAVRSRTTLVERLRDIPFLDAAALYGSVARGDMEPHSDIDLLLLCSSGRKRALLEIAEPSLSGEFTKLSLALYSHQELEFLGRVHSLFLLHLKREAKILIDRAGYLGALLSNFRPKPSYKSDFVESLALLDLLRMKVARSPNDLHRLSFVYSLFRVFGVYLLAERGIFEFSKSKMAACLSREYPHAHHAISMLSELRVLNSNFFSGGGNMLAPGWLGSDSALQGCLSGLCRLVEAPSYVIERPYREAIAEFSAAAADHQRLNYKLRTWFLLLAYDGLNLYLRSVGLPPLISLETAALEKVLSEPLPSQVANAALQTLSCIRDYRLRYFLNKDAKVSADWASQVLCALADVL